MTMSFIGCKSNENKIDRGASGRLLLESVKLGANKRVALLLAEGAYTEVRDDKGDTPLLYAVKTGNVQCARMLLNHHVEHRARSSKGKNSLEIALDSGNVEMVRCLIDGGVSPDEMGYNGNPLLHKAVKFDDVRAVDLLLSEGANPNVAGQDGRTSLHVAVEQMLGHVVTALVQAGADVNIRDDKGATPLWLATQMTRAVERRAMITRLLDHGADPTIPAPDKGSILAHAVRLGLAEEVTMLIDYGARVNDFIRGNEMSLLSMAAQSGYEEILLILLSRGADVTSFRKDAVAYDREHSLHLFLQYFPLYGMDTDSSGYDNLKDEMVNAVKKSDYTLVDMLLRHGVNFHNVTDESQSLLNMAVAKRDSTMVRLLLEHGASPNTVFKRPVSNAFLKLVEKKSMRWFLEHERRITPLMMAANNGDLEIIKSLVEYGAKKFVYSGRHRLYPVHFASRRGDAKAMQLILGQDPDNEKMHAVLDLSEQRVRLYNHAGEVIFSSRVSTGKRGFRTPKGTFVITDKHRSHTSSIYGSSMPYFQRLSCSAFGFHSGHCPGYPASHGCIRMPYRAAKKLFSLTPVGTRVVIKP